MHKIGAYQNVIIPNCTWPNIDSVYTTYGSAISELRYQHLDAADTAVYRFRFNGQERDNEVAGERNSYSAEFWQYDGRLGRRWNQDIIERSNFSPYGVFANNPILYVDKVENDWYIYAEVNSFEFKSEYTIKWINASAEIFDPTKYYYQRLRMSLTYGHLVEYTRLKCGLFGDVCSKTILAPLFAYFVSVDFDLARTLDENGYNEYGGYFTERPSWFYDGQTGMPSPYSTNVSKVFMANESVTMKNFFTVIMYSFLSGKGPENFYFGTEHEISKSLMDSKLVTPALKMFKDDSDQSEEAMKLRNGEWIFIDIPELEIFNILVRSKEDGTAFNPEHLIGSALARITKSEDGKNYVINIWNSTSLGSGTIGFPSLPKPESNDSAAQPLTNVSQTNELLIPID